jgi:hypothetical protein
MVDMFELDVQDDLPHWSSPHAVRTDELDRLFQRALETQHLLQFSLEELRPKSDMRPQIRPMFAVHFGHFGFKVRGLSAEATRTLNQVWSLKGRLIDVSIFHQGLLEFGGMWMLNHVSFVPMGPFRLKSVPNRSEPPVVSTMSQDWSHVCTVRHRNGFEEVVPYCSPTEDEHWLGRWVQDIDSKRWHLEWLNVPVNRFHQLQIQLHHRERHMAAYPLVDVDPIRSDFFATSDMYLPPNFVLMLTEEQQKRQLEQALWWMESRFRLVPRYPKSALSTVIQQSMQVGERFQLPMMTHPMSTTEILTIYSRRGNSILKSLLQRTHTHQEVKM